ncbi:MAG TPA: TatD family hydrolase [Armatimonadota bacterium]|jgi:TatD DNase family protein
MIDTHAHLNDPKFDLDREEVRLRARQAGVERVIHCGYSLESSQLALRMAREWGDAAALGIHPHDALALDEDVLRWIREAAADPAVVAVGEVGLDFHYDRPEPHAQKEALRRQFVLAQELALPLVLHVRESHAALVQELQDHGRGPGGVFHCFTGTLAEAEEALALGFYLGAGGVVAFPKSGELRATFASVPLERILLETDSPYLAPPPYRGKRCEPAYVARVLEVLAEVRGMPREALEQATTENALRCFPKLLR